MDDRTPVLIGAGMASYRGPPVRDPDLSPAGLAAAAAQRALADAGIGASAIDRIAAVRMTADNLPPGTHPFGTPDNFPRAVACRIGSDPRTAVYGVIGGQSPQDFVNECAERLYLGECEVALIVAAEATGLERSAQRAGPTLDWAEEVGGQIEDRGPGSLNLHPVEIRHGLFVPVIVYSLIEQAQRARAGRSRAEHVLAMADLFASFSRVAASHSHAQFPDARTAAFLASQSADNYRLTDLYMKWLVAQDAVNQGAAVLMTTSSRADQMGVPHGRRVYLHGYGSVADLPLIERPDLGASQGVRVAGTAAFAMAGLSPASIDSADIYSCFPCAVVATAEALGLPQGDGERLTVTGGLPFFGGPGNGYSLFAIAEMVARLRARPQAFGLVTANGGFMSKESVGIYGAAPPSHWGPAPAQDLASQLTATRVAVDERPEGVGTVESFSLFYRKGEPAQVWIIGRLESSRRFVATATDAADLLKMAEQDLVGRRVAVRPGGKTNSFSLLS